MSEKTEVVVNPLNPAQVQPAGHRILELEAIVPANTDPAAIISPDMWVHVFHKFQVACKIHVLWEDLTKYAIIMCTHLNGRASRFVCLETYELEAGAVQGVDFGPDFDVQQKGVRKWCIVDKKTGHILKDMIPTQAQALVELEDVKKARQR